jgi:hypothetical protein
MNKIYKKIFTVTILLFTIVTLTACNVDNIPEDGEITPINYRSKFITAKDELSSSDRFEYNYELSVDTDFFNLGGPSALSNGTVKYNNNLEYKYYKKEVNSGILRYDNTIYSIRKDDVLTSIKLNEKDIVYDSDMELVATDFKYESSSFAKVLFEYDEKDIKEVILDKNGKYKINYSGGVSNYVDTALELIGSSVVDYFIDLPEIDKSLTTYVTFNDNSIGTYEYNFTISLKGATLSFNYMLEIIKLNEEVLIEPLQFEGLSLDQNDINEKLSQISLNLDLYKNLENTSYDFDIKTEVDFASSIAINSRSQGHTLRYVEGDNVFFNNRLEFDSDYKNNDLYKSFNIKDYERYRVKYENLDVYDIEDIVGPFNNYKKLEQYDNSKFDEYYFLLENDFFNINYISVIQYISVNNKNIYNIGLSYEGVQALLDFTNKNVRVDVNLLNNIEIFNNIGDLEIGSIYFQMVFEDNLLKSIEIEIKGRIDNKYENTKFEGPATFKLEYNISTSDRASGYIPPKENKDVILEE